MMSSIGLVSLSVTEIVLFSLLLGLIGLVVIAFRRISQLETRLEQSQRQAQREIKMVNQGAIGIGRRFATIEKRLKKPEKVADFAAIRAQTLADAKSPAKSVPTAQPKESAHARSSEIPSPKKRTKAERALSAWLNDHQSA